MNRILNSLGLAFALLASLPLLIVVPMSFSSGGSLKFPPTDPSFQNYVAFLQHPAWMGAIWNSLIIGFGTAVVTMIVSVPAAFAITRSGSALVTPFRLLIILPMTVPHIVMAVGYFGFLSDIALLYTHLGTILAHSCFAIPMAVLILVSSLSTFDSRLEYAAASLGASPLRVLWLVTFPVLRPAFLVAALLAFITSFDETTVSLFITGAHVATLPKQMYTSFQMEADPMVPVASTLIIAVISLSVVGNFVFEAIRKRYSRSEV